MLRNLSRLEPIASQRANTRFTPQKRTFIDLTAMSAKGQKRTRSYLLRRCTVADSALLLAFMMRRSPSHVLIWLAARQFS